MFRIIDQARKSKNPLDRFSFLVTELATVSGVANSAVAQLSALQDQVLVNACKFQEETDGRINTDNLDHLMVLGAPFLPSGDGDLQDRLKAQVEDS